MTLDVADELVERVEQRRQEVSASLGAIRRAELGQYFTPARPAGFLAAQFELPTQGVFRILDPGAGVGSLTTALVARVLRERPGLTVEVTACEVDANIHAALGDTLQDCEVMAGKAGGTVATHIICSDFIGWAASSSAFDGGAQFDAVIMNPPYRKLGRTSIERRTVAACGTDASNLYTAFLVMVIQLLTEGGQLVAITPRSFTNGPYFKAFRHFFHQRMDLERLHIYESRKSVFADTDVLQENVIFTARRTDEPRRPSVEISVSRDHGDEPVVRGVPFSQVIHPQDQELFWHIDLDEDSDRLAYILDELPASLSDLGLQVSTGRVVDFRATDHLHQDPLPGDVPLIYPLHMREGRFVWPVHGARKNNAIAYNGDTRKLTFPAGHYTVVKRLSSKEERRRVVAAYFDPDEIACEHIGFENHVNVLHSDGEGLTGDIARGLTLWLNSTLLDELLRRFSGHTQVNATDLRNLRYPSHSELTALGAHWLQGPLPSQEEIDALVSEHVSACSHTLGE